MPWSGPRSRPRLSSESALAACSRARSRVIVTTQLYLGPCASSRSRKNRASSTAETAPDLSRPPSTVKGAKARSEVINGELRKIHHKGTKNEDRKNRSADGRR